MYIILNGNKRLQHSLVRTYEAFLSAAIWPVSNSNTVVAGGRWINRSTVFFTNDKNLGTNFSLTMKHLIFERGCSNSKKMLEWEGNKRHILAPLRCTWNMLLCRRRKQVYGGKVFIILTFATLLYPSRAISLNMLNHSSNNKCQWKQPATISQEHLFRV